MRKLNVGNIVASDWTYHVSAVAYDLPGDTCEVDVSVLSEGPCVVSASFAGGTLPLGQGTSVAIRAALTGFSALHIAAGKNVKFAVMAAVKDGIGEIVDLAPTAVQGKAKRLRLGETVSRMIEQRLQTLGIDQDDIDLVLDDGVDDPWSPEDEDDGFGPGFMELDEDDELVEPTEPEDLPPEQDGSGRPDPLPPIDEVQGT